MSRIIFVCTLLLCLTQSAEAQVVDVRATAETDPVPSDGDAADDPAFWIHPTDAAQSLVIGTDKQGGVAVYDLDGSELAYLADGELNNVDVRYGFVLGGETVDLVTAGNRTENLIAIYRVDGAARTLVDVAAGSIGAGIEVYGSCMYRSASSGETYVFVNSKDGEVVQHRLIDDGGRVGAEEVRRFDAGGQTEGCVADDELGRLYVGEEAEGIWRYAAEPDGGDERVSVDTTSGGNLAADVEGLALYLRPGGAGYLIASSQGDDTYAVYERDGDNAYIGSFRVIDGDGIDGTSGTDGLDVTSAALGPSFPEGLFAVQDGSNSGGNQNYKLVAWEAIAGAFSPPLAIDTAWDPRGETPMPDPDTDGGTPGADAGPDGEPDPDAGGTAFPRTDAGTPGPGASDGTGAMTGGCAAASPSDRGSSLLFLWSIAALIAIRRRR